MAETEAHRSNLSLDTPLLTDEEASIYNEYLRSALQSQTRNPSDLLQSIPCPQGTSYAPLATVSALASSYPGRLPLLELQQAYSKSWRVLPEDAKSGRGSPQVKQLLERSLQQCQQSYSSLIELLHASSTSTAIIDPENGQSISHESLVRLVRNFRLPVPTGSQRKPVVAISLPNGPLLALTVLATATYYVAAPVAHGNGVGAEQFKADVIQSKTNFVIASSSDVSRLGLRDQWLADANIKVLLAELTPDISLVVRELDGNVASDGLGHVVPNNANDTGILLFTSGTSGTKKLVPLTIHSMVCGVAMVIESWGLSPSMRCLNQMPLNHVGGLIRNLFAPIMSGGSVICCSAFDANLFWDCVEDLQPTWYYASPSMHQGILEVGEERPEAMEKSQIKLVCNAAGGLLPSLACRLRDTFNCIVLPSYGMTECMPISTPPLGYRLDRTGTSGISVGPEITILDGKDKPVETNVVGRIAVRGAPVFGGYLKANDEIDKSCFTHDGQFDTGDMGYLDDDGYLYITGRSKEVINRGGELISPFEVEEAIVAAANSPSSPTYGRITKALAFSVMHDVLQEVVGICIVTPPGRRRACLRKIQDSVSDTLSQVKIPVLVVYMDGGVPTNNNKILRIKLAERLSLPEISDNTPSSQQHFEATCPPQNTALTEKIGCRQLSVDHVTLLTAFRKIAPDDIDAHCSGTDVYPRLFVAPKSGREDMVSRVQTGLLMEGLAEMLHGYQMPSDIQIIQQPLPKTQNGVVDDLVLNDMLVSKSTREESSSGLSPLETTVANIFAQILSVAASDLSSDSDFFNLGGDSMKAGRLLSMLRKEFQIRLSIDQLFSNRTVSSLAALIDSKRKELRPIKTDTANQNPTAVEQLLPGCEETRSSTSPIQLLVHLIPLCIFYPGKRALTWTVFIYCLSYTLKLITNLTIPGRLVNLSISILIARCVTRTVFPVLAIIFKWLVIGRYQEGLYPMWGAYHTRWWICQKAIQVAGMGVWGSFNWSRCLYYRALGVKIGKNVSLNKGVTLGEYDLITLEDGVTLERCIVRPFAAERNTSMYLGRVALGTNSSVGLGSIVAAGTSLPPNTCLGPNSSSWEVEDADEANGDLCASKIPSAHWILKLLLGFPIQFFTVIAGLIPWLGCLAALVDHPPQDEFPDRLRNIAIWFAAPRRVGLHYTALAAGAALGPVFFFVAVLIFKKIFDLCCGKLQSGDASTFSQMTKFRRELLRTLLPAPQLHKLTELFGSHYDATSTLYRLMGSKVGKRVYWPGTGPSTQDYDLIEVGNDVVFGSRSHLVTSDATGSEPVRIGDNAMVADRVVLLPGVELGKETVMGSGALTRRNGKYPAASTWVGSKKGDSVCLSSSSNGLGGKNFSSNSSSTTLAGSPANASPTSSSGDWNYPDLEKGGPRPRVNEASSPSTVGGQDAAGDWKQKEYLPGVQEEESTSSPFGRAFYQKKAPYRVWSQFEIFLYSSIITVASAVYWNVGSISANQIIAYIFARDHSWWSTVALSPHTWARPLSYYFLFLLWSIGFTTFQAILVLVLLIAAKWVLMGRRKAGCYSWDLSPYCQRWQLYLKLEAFRRSCYGGSGILGLLTGTHWIVLYFRALGADIGKDCALFAGGSPSLMFTEPDLLTLGNRVSVDDASLVAHINTRGKFDLNPLAVGDRSVLRSGSRLLSGAKMEEDTCLLEHTLVMAGDVVDAGCTNQGWPAEDFKGERMPTMKSKKIWVLRRADV